jgi:hypothetical protein
MFLLETRLIPEPLCSLQTAAPRCGGQPNNMATTPHLVFVLGSRHRCIGPLLAVVGIPLCGVCVLIECPLGDAGCCSQGLTQKGAPYEPEGREGAE